MNEAKTMQVLTEIRLERGNQENKWGEQNHNPFIYLAILGEEVGEANQAALQSEFGGKQWKDYRAELVHVAAVAVAMVECLDRHNGKPPAAQEVLESFQDAVRKDPDMTPERKAKWLQE